MAIKCVMSVYDLASNLYGQPFFVPAVAAAIRSVGDETNRAAADNALYQHPEDFEVFQLCCFDDVTGQFHPIVIGGAFDPMRVARCKDLVNATSVAKQS